MFSILPMIRFSAAHQPEFRSGGNMAYDEARKLHVLFGSQFNDDQHTWTYDVRRNEWQDMQPEVQPPTDKNDAVLTYDPLHRVVIGRIYHHTVKLLFGLKVRDIDCDFRLMRRRIFDQVRLEKNSGVICLEMMKKFKDAGFRVAEVPVHHYHRTHGTSQFFNFRRVARTGVDVLKLWWALVIRREHLRAPAAAAAPLPMGREPR